MTGAIVGKSVGNAVVKTVKFGGRQIANVYNNREEIIGKAADKVEKERELILKYERRFRNDSDDELRKKIQTESGARLTAAKRVLASRR